MAGKDADKKGANASGAKGGKKKKIIIAAPVVLVLAAAGWFFFLRGDGAPEKLPPPVAGTVVQLDPITINLAGGHFLKLGMALQAIEGAHSEPNGAKALDLAITQFSGKTIEELSSSGGRVKAKAELTARIKLAYLPHVEGEEEAAPKATTKGADPESKGDAGGHGASQEHHDDSTLTAAEAIEKAKHLTVHPEVYEVYFTEFVMQ